jgi:hypothetical protein
MAQNRAAFALPQPKVAKTAKARAAR